MAWLISVLGAALALAGGYALWNGVSYIRLDWGQAETVAGTVALSAGIVTLALGAVLFALRGLARLPMSRPAGVGLEALTWSEDDPPVPPMMNRVKSKLATVGMPKAPNADVEASMVTLPGPARDLDAPPVGHGFDPAARDGVPDAPAVHHPFNRAGEPPHPPEAATPAPTVVGRYEANGASYVLFSDGTIEVETESGTHRFASMAELRDHIERQEAV